MTIENTKRLFDQYAYTLDELANEPETDDPEARRRLLKACAHGMREAAQSLIRYEWIKSAKGLTLRSDGTTKWTRKDGSTYRSSHYLAGNDTQYASYETLDETLDEAMKVDSQR